MDGRDAYTTSARTTRISLADLERQIEQVGHDDPIPECFRQLARDPKRFMLIVPLGDFGAAMELLRFYHAEEAELHMIPKDLADRVVPDWYIVDKGAAHRWDMPQISETPGITTEDEIDAKAFRLLNQRVKTEDTA